MVAVNQNDLRVKNAQNLIHSLVGGSEASNSYLFVGRPSQWETDIAVPMVAREIVGDMSPPYPQNNIKDFYKIWNQMLFLKRLHKSDVMYMIPRITWTSGVTYDMYRHDYSKVIRSTSNAQNLYDALFYVINQNRDVYACLDNNGGSQSQVEPLNLTGEPFHLSDGYQWIKLFRVTDMDFRNRSTNNFIPICSNEVNTRPPGAINTVIIETPGNDFVKRPAGVADDVPYYYCNVNGDGRGAVARIQIELGRVNEIRIVRSGNGYSYGTLDFTPNNVYASLYDLDMEQNGLNPGGDSTFKCTVIISPPNGWGYNYTMQNLSVSEHAEHAKFELARQLGGTRVCVFSTLKHNLFNKGDVIKDTTFRQLGIIQDPIDLRTDTVSNETMSACFAMKVLKTLETDATQFIVGEMISQQINNDVLAKGQIVSVESDDSGIVVKYIQDPELHANDKGELHPFAGPNLIEGDTSNVNATIDLDYTGEINDLTFFEGLSNPEVRKYSGIMSYVQNISAVTRQETQTERVSLMVEY